MRDWLDVRSKRDIYQDGVTSFAVLPEYIPYDVSYRNPLTYVDCHQALAFSIRKARLNLFELKRRASGLKRGRLVLDGRPRRLDDFLSRTSMLSK